MLCLERFFASSLRVKLFVFSAGGHRGRKAMRAMSRILDVDAKEGGDITAITTVNWGWPMTMHELCNVHRCDLGELGSASRRPGQTSSAVRTFMTQRHGVHDLEGFRIGHFLKGGKRTGATILTQMMADEFNFLWPQFRIALQRQMQI